ncbi:15895_t:CDS:2, partial [Acaulospora colombiana]
MRLADARRVVLLNYNSDTKHIDFRHYSIGVKPVGISKSVRRVVTDHIPDLHNYEDISEYVLRERRVSDSEAESSAGETVTLAQDFIGRANKKFDQRAIKLSEIGPRMELQLVKIQNGLCDGEVLYHEFVHKTPEEIKKMTQERERRTQQAALRRKEQERNVERKKLEKEAQRIASIKEQGVDIVGDQRSTNDEEDDVFNENLDEEDDILFKDNFDEEDDALLDKDSDEGGDMLFEENSDERDENFEEDGKSESSSEEEHSIKPRKLLKSRSKERQPLKNSVDKILRQDTTSDFAKSSKSNSRQQKKDSMRDGPKKSIKVSM